MMPMSFVPVHDQIAGFRVGAILATQAIAVYIDLDGPSGQYGAGQSFNDLPPRLKVRVLAACEEEFRRRKEDLIRDGERSRDWTLGDLADAKTGATDR